MGLALLCIAAATAATAAQPATDVEPQNIVVTGERVKRLLRDTPSSVEVITAERIEAQGVDRLEQLLAAIPNVQLGSGGDGPAVRGQDTTGVLHDLPAFLGGNRPRMTLQVDGRAVSYNEFAYGTAPLWDVQRVEVFRSPQTTTQGRNSIAGAVFIETADPSWDWEGRGRAIAGNYDTRQLSAVVSGPVVDDQLAIRLSADRRHSRTTSELGRNARGGPDPNADDYGQVRAKLLLQPKALRAAKLQLVYAHTESHAPQVEGISPPFRDRRDPDATYGIFRTNVDSATGRFSYQPTDFSGANATVSYGDAHVRRFAPAGFGETNIHSRDLSGEVIGTWRVASAVDLLGGVSALRTHLDQRIDLSATPLGIGTFDDVQRSIGAFGQAALRPTTRVTITAGLRYQRDRQDRVGMLATMVGPLPLDYHRTFDAWLPKASLEYAANANASIGLLVERAFNPGGTTLNLSLGKQDEFVAETLWDYELFARISAPDKGLTLAANLFYYDMHDAQRPQQLQITPPGSPGPIGFVAISNAPRARAYGAEAELSWHPSERLSFRGGIGLLSTRVTKTVESSDPLLGKRFQRSPSFTGSASIDWRPVRVVQLSAQVRHNSPYFSDDSETPVLRVGGSTTLDARAAVDVGRLTFFAYAHNLTNEFHLTFLINPDLATAGVPRQVGAGVEAKF
jgi:outer membrane receptor protein involved in Fe transport